MSRTAKVFGILQNVLQPSTLRAVMVVASAFGLQVETEPIVQGVSMIGMAAYALWETFRNASRPVASQASQAARPSGGGQR